MMWQPAITQPDLPCSCTRRRSLLLVSRRWQRCCCSEPSLWNPFRIPWCPARSNPVAADAQQQWLDASFSVLERVSGLATELHVESGSMDSHNRLPLSWVAALAAAALHHLAHQRPPMLAAVRCPACRCCKAWCAGLCSPKRCWPALLG